MAIKKRQPGRRNLDDLKSPELNDADFKRMRPAREVVPLVVDGYLVVVENNDAQSADGDSQR